MNFMISESITPKYHKRKVTTMTDTIIRHYDTDTDELHRLRREKHRERRRRQLSAFYENMRAQNADKLIFLFDNDLNIA